MNAIASAAKAVTRNWPWMALIACIAMLGTAHYFETFHGLIPCEMCLMQRLAYWMAGGVALAGAVVGCTRWGPRFFRLICGLLALAFAFGLFWAAWQAGGEQHWWSVPAECSSNPHAHPITAADIQALLNGKLKPPPACDKPSWWFLGLTMAAWNMLVSAGLAGWSAYAALRKDKP